MSDRELLELAAKAAGACLHPKDKLSHSYGNWGCDTTCMVCKKDPCDAPWKPLTNDGDALRLAVKLKMLVDVSASLTEAAGGTCEAIGKAAQTHDGKYDAFAATRRAIVRAAAEIGKAMP